MIANSFTILLSIGSIILLISLFKPNRKVRI